MSSRPAKLNAILQTGSSPDERTDNFGSTDAPVANDISVVIPAFNRADLIGRAIRSASAQTLAAAEIIVVDDGSSDDTAAVARSLGATVISQPNQGEGAARNTGIMHAATEWVALLDSDDEWLPHHLEVLSSARQADRDCVLAATASLVSPSGRYLGYPKTGHHLLRGPRSAIIPTSPFAPSAALVRKESVVAAGGFPALPLGADLDMWIRLLETGTGVVTSTVTCRYFRHEGQVSNDNRANRYARLSVFERYEGRPWANRQLRRAIQATLAWDDLNISVRSRDLLSARESINTLIRSRGAGIQGVASLVRWRHRSRRMEAELDRPTVKVDYDSSS